MRFEFEKAYDYFNQVLFDGELPPVLITVQRKRGTRGFFRPDSFEAKDGDDKAHELAMNPESFDRDDRLVLSTLSHEMCHVWQEVFGKASKSTYHNKQWAAKMIEVGLMPSNTGAEGGKQTGAQMTHYIIQGGAFDNAAQVIIENGFKIDWVGFGRLSAAQKKKNKIKYTCPDCGLNAWGKPDIMIVCWNCQPVTRDDIDCMEADE